MQGVVSGRVLFASPLAERGIGPCHNHKVNWEAEDFPVIHIEMELCCMVTGSITVYTARRDWHVLTCVPLGYQKHFLSNL